jgi:hypothetical protein
MVAYSTKSVLFNGTTQYGTAGDVFSFEYTDDFSISCWVKTTDTGGYLVNKQDTTANYRGYGLALNASGETDFVLRSGPGNYILVKSTTGGLNDGAWHHIVVTWSGDATPVAADVTLYVDGTPETPVVVQDTLSGTIITAADLTVASRDGTEEFRAGNLDEVAIYNKVLNAAEVLQIFNAGNPSNLLDAGAPTQLDAWWRMGEDASGVIIPDQTGINFPAQHPPNTDPNLTEALYLNSTIDPDSATNGYNQNASFGNVTEMNFGPNDPFTLGIWVRTNDKGTGGNWATTTSKTLFSKIAISYYAGSSEGWRFYTFTGGNIGFVFGSDSSNYIGVLTTDGGFCDGLWRLLTVTYDGSGNISGLKLFIDGEQVAVNTYGSGTVTGDTTTTQDLVVGAASTLNGGKGYFHNRGLFCHSFGYDVELTPAEVALLYTDGRPQDLSGMAHSANLVHWCRLGDDCTLSTMSIQVTATTRYCYANAGSIFNFDYDDDFSIAGWFRTTDSGSKYLVTKMWSVSPYEGYRLMILSGELYFSLQLDSTSYIVSVQTTDGPYNDDAWHHVVATWSGSLTPDASDITIYVDGSPATTTVVNNTLNPSSSWSKQALHFPGGISPSKYVDCGNSSTLDHQWDTDDRTYSFWMKTPGGGQVMGKSDWSGGHGLKIYTSGGYLYFELEATSGNEVRVGATTTWISDDVWLHCVIVVPAPADATTMKIYINGVDRTLSTLSNNLTSGDDTTDPAEPFLFGLITTNGSTPFDGHMDEIGIYNSALSAGDVADLYNSFSPPDPTGLSSWSSNIGYWRMGDGDTYPTLTDSGNGTSNDGTMTNMSTDDIVPFNSILNDAVFNFGTYNSRASNTFLGYLDEMAVYDKTLSAGEVTDIYNGGVVPNDLRALSSDPNLVGWWRMGDASDQVFAYNLYDYSQNSYLMKTSSPSGVLWDFESPHNYGMVDLSPLGNDGRTYGVREVGVLSDTPPIVYPTPYNPTTESMDLNNDATDEIIDFGAEVYVHPGAAMTIGAWIKTTDAAGGVIFNRGRSEYNAAGYVFRLSGSGINMSKQWQSSLSYAQWTGGGDFIPVNDDEWHFVAVTLGPDDFSWPYQPAYEFFIDAVNSIGIFKGTGGGGSYYISGTNNVVGARGYPAGTYNNHIVGQICHAFMYDKGLTEFEIAEIRAGGIPQDLTVMGPTSNLIFWTGLGDGDTVGPDNVIEKALGNDGTAVNMERDPDNPLSDSPGGSFSQYSIGFAGSQYANLGNVLNFERTDPFSWSFWIKLTSAGEVISNSAGPTTYRGYEVYVYTDGRIALTIFSDNAASNRLQTRTTSGELTPGVWAHVCVCYDGSSAASGVTIYVNGSSKAVDEVLDTLTATIVHAGDLNFGRRATTGDIYVFADLDDIAVYDKELTGPEVTAIFNAGQPNNLSLLSSWANNVGWWKMGDGDTFPTLSDSGNGSSNDATYVPSGNDWVEDVPMAGDPLTLVGGPTISDDFPSTFYLSAFTAPPAGYGIAPEWTAPLIQTGAGSAGSRVTYNYLMRGLNAGGGYVHWKVLGSPDLLAIQAPETIPDLSTVAIAGEWKT